MTAIVRTICAIVCAAGALAPRDACAQVEANAFPAHAITLLVAFPPGGPPDVIARAFATPMARALGAPVVIENRPGASSSIAAVALVRSAPDGHTIMATDISQSVAPHILKSPGFDPVKDFAAISMTTRAMQTLFASASLPAKSVAELVALAKAKPDDIKVAHSGIGGPPYLAAVDFMHAAGVKLPLVYYRGIAQAVSDVVGGHVGMLFTGASVTAELHNAGKARVLAVTGPKRLASLPDVPTLDESGIKLNAMQNGNWFGLVAPAGTPAAVIAKLNAAVRRAGADPALAASLAKLEISVETSTPEELATIIRNDYAYWGDTLKAMGVAASE